MTEQAHCADHSPAADDSAHNAPTDDINPVDQAMDRAAAGPREIGGRPGPEPTRYGDWEMRGRCIDF